MAADDGAVRRLVFGARDFQAHSRHLSVSAGCVSFAHKRGDLAARVEKRNSCLAQAKKRTSPFRTFDPWRSVVLVFGLAVWAAEKFPQPALPKPLGITYGSPSGDPPNSPMGVAKGIFPGRVTWMRDTNATP